MSLNDLKAQKARVKSSFAEARRLKEKAREVRDELFAKESEVILQLTRDFVELMKNERQRRLYITNSRADYWAETSEFLTHVDRDGKAVSKAHQQAMDEYKAALENLNTVFVEELTARVDARKFGVPYAWTLKNLDK